MRTDKKQNVAGAYVRDNFAPSDRLAVVLIHKRRDEVIQRLASAESIAAPDFEAWLRHKNAAGHEVYVSMNALREDARGRTKADVAEVRHVYLDFDDYGTEAVERLMKREDLPTPNYVLSTSPGKWQVVWKVDGFTKDQSEELQRGLARETGADPAATDCARVLRLPGFYNHKYAQGHLVKAQALATEVYQPERFPKFPAEGREERFAPSRNHSSSKNAPSKLSQSERDWAYAKRALARGDSKELIVTAIALHRRFDKHDPQAYAERTVRKAAESLSADQSRASQGAQPQR